MKRHQFPVTEKESTFFTQSNFLKEGSRTTSRVEHVKLNYIRNLVECDRQTHMEDRASIFLRKMSPTLGPKCE